ncbi:MAG: hypothetical protein LC687_00350 [Actinobacteria bacterium]|nr:hypothetical protein [Actinomycetota bacterium]
MSWFLDNINGPFAVASVTGLFAAIVAGIGWAATLRKVQKQAKKDVEGGEQSPSESNTILAQVLEWSKRLERQLAKVEHRLEEVEEQNKLLRWHNTLLTTQIEDLGEVPIAMPTKYPWDH